MLAIGIVAIGYMKAKQRMGAAATDDYSWNADGGTDGVEAETKEAGAMTAQPSLSAMASGSLPEHSNPMRAAGVL
jgi:hypothetical protein